MELKSFCGSEALEMEMERAEWIFLRGYANKLSSSPS
jgi:hypothetical protein